MAIRHRVAAGGRHNAVFGLACRSHWAGAVPQRAAGLGHGSTGVTVGADLAVHTMIESTEPAYFERIAHGGSLPDLLRFNLILYVSPLAEGPVMADLAALIRRAYRGAHMTDLASDGNHRAGVAKTG